MPGPTWITPELWGDTPEAALANQLRYLQFLIATWLFGIAGAGLLVAAAWGVGSLAQFPGWIRYFPGVIFLLVALVCGLRLKVFVDEARQRRGRRPVS